MDEEVLGTVSGPVRRRVIGERKEVGDRKRDEEDMFRKDGAAVAAIIINYVAEVEDDVKIKEDRIGTGEFVLIIDTGQQDEVDSKEKKKNGVVNNNVGVVFEDEFDTKLQDEGGDEEEQRNDVVNNNDGAVFEEMESIQSDSNLEEVKDDILEQSLEKESLKEHRVELNVDLRQEEVDEDENEQGDEGKMARRKEDEGS